MSYQSRSFFVGLTVVLLIVAGIFAYMHWSPKSAESVGRARDAKEADKGSAQEAAKEAPVIATVYECTGPQGRVFSDKPCADDAKVREVRAPNRLSGESESEAASDEPPRDRPRYPAR